MDFFGIVGQQADFRQAKILEQLDADAVIADVGLITQCQIGFDGVEPLVLQGVGLDLVDQPDATPFLRQINQNAGPA